MLTHSLRRSVLAALVAATAVVALAAPPAGATDPDLPYFQDITGSSVAVNGAYRPIVGHFTDSEFDDIIWYAAGATKERQWTPCPGCASGRFTEAILTTQVIGVYEPVVGDFAGDGLADIYWLNRRDGHDYLWTNNGSGSFTSRQLDMAPGNWDPIVLTDSQSGDGKDDILWQPDHQRPAPLWVFPDDGSGAARTVARLTLPVGRPLVGDFDGNGAADVFWYYRPVCRCSEPGPASVVDTYWRRASSTAPGFIETKRNVKGMYEPVVGHLSGGGDARDDILWVGGPMPFGDTGVADSPDSFWEGQPDGSFRSSSPTLSHGVYPVLLGHDVADTVFFPVVDTVWFDTTSGPVLRPTGSLPEFLGQPVVGRFTTPDRADLLAYYPGAKAEHLYHPTF